MIDDFISSFSLKPDLDNPPIHHPNDYLAPLEQIPSTAPLVPILRGILITLATIRDLLEPLEGLDPTYPLGEPLGQDSGGQEDESKGLT